MSVKINDKRCTAAADIDPEAEAERMRRRAGVRAEAAKLQFEKDRIPVLQAVLDESHARVEVATSEHQATCDPLQIELESLEAAAVERIQRRESPDATADARRAEILREIANANAELESVVEAEKIARAPTEREAWRLRNEVLDPKAVLQRLAQPPLVNPSLVVESHVARQRSSFATARVAAAKVGLQIAETNLGTIRRGITHGDLSVHEHKRACWTAELEAAEVEQAVALAEGERIHKAKIDE